MLVSQKVGKNDRNATKHSYVSVLTTNRIYHLEVANHCLNLIYELIDDGLESYISPNNSINGFIFFISCIYYRSSWKYQNRGVRYCFLDSGYHLGAVAASAYVRDRNVQLIFDA